MQRSLAASGLLLFTLQTFPAFADTILPDADKPNLNASPASLSFGTWQIGSRPPADQSINITSTGPGKGVAVTGNPGDCNWLGLNGGSGDTPFKASVSVKTAGIATGKLSCTMTF